MNNLAELYAINIQGRQTKLEKVNAICIQGGKGRRRSASQPAEQPHARTWALMMRLGCRLTFCYTRPSLVVAQPVEFLLQISMYGVNTIDSSTRTDDGVDQGPGRVDGHRHRPLAAQPGRRRDTLPNDSIELTSSISTLCRR